MIELVGAVVVVALVAGGVVVLPWSAGELRASTAAFVSLGRGVSSVLWPRARRAPRPVAA